MTQESLPNWRRADTEEARLQEVARCQELLSSMPFHQKKVARTIELGGTEQDYWEGYYGNRQYTHNLPTKRSTAATTPASSA